MEDSIKQRNTFPCHKLNPRKLYQNYIQREILTVNKHETIQTYGKKCK
jgi:hypothetical protein